jgi:type IV secretory pathway TrbF-like protein
LPACRRRQYHAQYTTPAQETFMWQGLIVLLGLTFANAAAASGTISYGSRVGMEVSVISVEGLNTSRAVIRTKHTRENAVAFCRDYVGKVTEQCIRQELSVSWTPKMRQLAKVEPCP